ncbi:hypothetical protein TYRP_013742 [Tyrophagus putrescentiae]|nr:hypothetical protein TYRP_013742 [Tyrophagus putrescentiae]
MFLSTLGPEACCITTEEPLGAAHPPPLATRGSFDGLLQEHGPEAGGQDALKLEDDDLDVGEAAASRRSSSEDLVLFFVCFFCFNFICVR